VLIWEPCLLLGVHAQVARRAAQATWTVMEQLTALIWARSLQVGVDT
jgi:hypothetical protein